MTTYDTDADVIESAVAFSLIDPTLVAGRTHRLHNNSAGALVVSSTGATPFSQGGVNSATLTLAAGAAVNVYSNGTRWVVASGFARQTYAGTVVTDGSGLATFVFPVPFAVPPICQGHFGPSATTDLSELILVSVTTTQAVFRARRAPAVTILGISVITFPINAVGFTIQGFFTSPGATP